MLVAIFALSSNFLVTMLIVVVNKLLFTETKFPVITLSAAHMIVCVIFTTMCSRLQIFERRKMDAEERDRAGGIFTIVGDMSRASEFEDEFGGVFSTDETNASTFSRDGGVFLFIEDGF